MELFDEYKRHTDKAVRERANNWAAAIGLQKVNGLCVSELLIQLARQHIEGKITIEKFATKLTNIIIRISLIVPLMRLLLLTQR